MVKKVILCVLSALFFMACYNGKESNTEISSDDVNISEGENGSKKNSLPEIKFEEELHDFGKITQGEKVSYAFVFTNTGKTNLIISSAAGSCGCTVPEYPKEPILPGQKGKINVVFSSEGRSGLQEKTITMVTNCEPSTRTIKIRTEIIVPESVKEDY